MAKDGRYRKYLPEIKRHAHPVNHHRRLELHRYLDEWGEHGVPVRHARRGTPIRVHVLGGERDVRNGCGFRLRLRVCRTLHSFAKLWFSNTLLEITNVLTYQRPGPTSPITTLSAMALKSLQRFDALLDTRQSMHVLSRAEPGCGALVTAYTPEQADWSFDGSGGVLGSLVIAGGGIKFIGPSGQ